MKQARIVVRAVLLVGLCFLEASGSLRQHRLRETCQDLSNAASGIDSVYLFSEKTRCLVAGGKYCTATTPPTPSSEFAPSKDITAPGAFIYVGSGCCNDWDENLLDYVYFVGPLTVEQCEDKCISVRDEINSPLRGFERGTTADESDCFCIFDDEVISSVPDGASNVYTGNSGKGEVKSSTSACSIPFGQCYRYTNMDTTTHYVSFEYVGEGCCYDWDENFLDYVYFAGPLTVEQCGNKCISVSEEINSPLRGLERGTSEDETDCYCIFDDEVISSVPDGASHMYTGHSGKKG
jgi:hypothetical protein